MALSELQPNTRTLPFLRMRTKIWRKQERPAVADKSARRLSSGVVSCIASLPIDNLHMVSYYRPIVTLCLKCTGFEIWRHIGRKSPKNLPHSHLARSLGDPLRIFRRLIPCQKVESWGYQMMYISRSCFRSARHNTGVWQTDGRTDGQTDTSLSQRPR